MKKMIMLLIGTILLMGCDADVNITKDDNNVKINLEEKAEEQGEILDVNNSLVQELLGKTTWQNTIYTADAFEYLFKNEKVITSKMPSDIALSAAIISINHDNSKDNISVQEVRNSLSSLFGNNDYELSTKVEASCRTYTLDATGQNYSVTNNGGCGGTYQETYDEDIVSAAKYSDRIEVVTRVVFRTSHISDDGISDCSEYYSDFDYSNENKLYEECDTNEFKVDNYSDKLNNYKYTFKLDKENSNYYLYSFEKI